MKQNFYLEPDGENEEVQTPTQAGDTGETPIEDEEV